MGLEDNFFYALSACSAVENHKKSPLLVNKRGLLEFPIPSYLPRYIHLAGVSTCIPHFAGPVAVASSGQSLRHSG
jgi:hypothetical protein